ncbi:MAG TPA: ribonuclease P protein component [Lachnospiraceae bacterium]|jgi:ribonuclease P protein component|nr:ribonuclease P protein component [Lachnospiraceae bacterium]
MKYSESLKKTRDFSIVYQRGKSYANRTLVLYVLRKRGSERNRVGISVSKKVGNSVVRHRLTRLVRESYRLHETEFDRGLDLIVLVRPGAKESDFFTVERALLALGKRAEIKDHNAEKGGGHDHEEVHDLVDP